jgi:lipopolysaccharide transport system permease protein
MAKPATSASGATGRRTKAERRGKDRKRLGPRAEASDGATTSLPTSTQLPLHVVEPPAPGVRRVLSDYWHHRHAFLFFVRRFMRKRYGRTFFGILWLFLPVLLPLFMGALVFGGILGVSIPGVPYLLYFVVALSAWTIFAMTAYWATRSLEISRSEVRRVYVPRLIPLTASMTLPVITFLIYVGIGALTVGYYVLERGEFYLVLSPATLLVPVGIVALIVFGLACGLWFSPLAARARDVRRLAGYVLGFWYFLTPVMYPIDEIPSGFQFLASLNPVTAPIEMVKNGLINVGDVTSLGVVSYFVALVVVSVGGLLIFLRKERRDVVIY